MLSLTLLAMLASAAPEAAGPARFVPGSAIRSSGQAMVRLVSARAIPMSAESLVEAPQRRTKVRLADGEHDAFIVEFE
jgi:hypothetical protein